MDFSGCAGRAGCELLVGAGLLLRSFQALGRVSPGFDPNHVLTLRISGNYGETSDQKKMHLRMRSTLDALAAVASVESAAISASVPGAARGFPMEIKVTDAAVSPDGKITADEKVVYGAYFETMRMPLLGEARANKTHCGQPRSSTGASRKLIFRAKPRLVITCKSRRLMLNRKSSVSWPMLGKMA